MVCVAVTTLRASSTLAPAAWWSVRWRCAARRSGRLAGEFGAERITIALDARQDAQGQWQLPVHGWTENAGVTLDELAQRYARAGMRHLLCTDIARDGMLAGPNIGLYQHLSALLPGVAVQASGGIRDVADVAEARAAGCGGAILGKALLEQRMDLAEALAC